MILHCLNAVSIGKRQESFLLVVLKIESHQVTSQCQSPVVKSAIVVVIIITILILLNSLRQQPDLLQLLHNFLFVVKRHIHYLIDQILQPIHACKQLNVWFVI